MPEVSNHVVRRSEVNDAKVVLLRILPVLPFFRFKSKEQMRLGNAYSVGRV
jgi:hypothetical protein